MDKATKIKKMNYQEKLYYLSLYMDIWVTELIWRVNLFNTFDDVGYVFFKDSYVDDFDSWYLKQISKL